MDAALKAEALLVIGTQESDLTWNAVDYDSNIKVGVAQWVGQAAASLLGNLDPADRALLDSTLESDLTTYTAQDPFWSTRFLSKDEGNSIITALGTSTAKPKQVDFFGDTVDGYETHLTAWGALTDTTEHQKSFLFLLSIFHVDIVTANKIIATIGAVAPTGTILDALMNLPDIALRRDWLATKLLVDEWEGTAPTVTPSETQPNDNPGGSGQQTNTIVQVESQIQKIGMTGQNLIVYGQDNPTGVLCYRETNNLWLPVTNTAAPPTPTPIDPPQPDTPATQSEWEQMKQLWIDNEGAWRYGGSGGRLDPPTSGFSDCSACIIWAVGVVRPDLAKALGDYTGSMVNAGVEIARGNTGAGAHVDLDILKPGDILLVGRDYAFGDNTSHVEWYFGDGQLWGAGYSPLPHRSGDINNYLVMIASRGKPLYMIRRFL